MDKKIFTTIVKSKDEVEFSNDYVLGRIRGIEYAMCGGSSGSNFATMHCPQNGRRRFDTECSEEEYFAFKAMVNSSYPGLCIFDDEM